MSLMCTWNAAREVYHVIAGNVQSGQLEGTACRTSEILSRALLEGFTQSLAHDPPFRG